MPTINIKMADGSIKKREVPEGTTRAQSQAIADQERTAAQQMQQAKPQERQEQPTQGWEEVLQESLRSLGSAVPAAAETVKNLPGQAYETLKTNPLRIAGEFGLGLLEGGQGLSEVPANIAQYFKDRKIGPQGIEDFVIRNTTRNNYLVDLLKEKLGADGPGDALPRSIASFLPNLFGGGASMGAKMAAGALWGTGQKQDPIQSALMMPLMEGAAKGAAKAGVEGVKALPSIAKAGAERINPSFYLPDSPLTPEQLKERLRLTEGTETGLGNVIDNPLLKRKLENVLPDVPYSGANATMQRTGEIIKGKAEDIFNELKPQREVNLADVGGELQKSLIKERKRVQDEKRENYDKVNALAEKEDVYTYQSKVQKVARDKLREIKSDPRLGFFSDPALLKTLKNSAQRTTKPIGDTGLTTARKFSLKQTDLLRSKFGKQANKAFEAGDEDAGNIYKSLKDATTEDIDKTIDRSGNKELKQLRDKAHKYYKDEWVPFKDPNIKKFTEKEYDPDLLVQAFIKTSKATDRGRLLNKLTSKLPKDDVNMLAYDYFSRALEDRGGLEPAINPSKLATLFRDLGENQRPALLSKDMIKKLKDYTALAAMNTEPLNQMLNPKTGARGSLVAPLLTGVGGAAATGLTGGHPVLGGMLGLIQPAYELASGKPKTMLHTSEKVRNAVVKALIDKKEREIARRNRN